jgi:hypothetical protein
MYETGICIPTYLRRIIKMANTIFSIGDWLEVYGGEVLKAYNHNARIKSILRERVIASGKSASFPTLSVDNAKLHTPGADLFSGTTYDTDIASGEKVINIDKLLLAPVLLDDLDESMAHYDVRSELAAQAGAALATSHEAWAIAALGNGANSTQTLSGSFSAITGSMIASGLRGAAQTLDEAKVPGADRYAVIPPEHFYLLMNEDGVVSTDFGGDGSRSKGNQMVLNYMGFEVINSSLMKEFQDTTAAEQVSSTGPLYFGGTTQRTDNSWDNQLGFGICFHKDAAGTVTVKGVTAEADWVPERQAHLLVAKTGIGVDILRGESVVLLKTSAS